MLLVAVLCTRLYMRQSDKMKKRRRPLVMQSVMKASAGTSNDLARTKSHSKKTKPVVLTCPLMPCWVMKVFRAPVSEFWG